LSARKTLNQVFGNGAPNPEFIHIIIKADTPAAPPAGNQQQLIDNLRAELARTSKLKHTFHLMIKPRTAQSVPWHVDLNSVKLTDLQTLIAKEYPKFEDTTLSFCFRLGNGITDQPSTDQDLQELLRTLVTNNRMIVKIAVTTPTKPYSEWTLPAVCKLFGLAENGRFPPFSCGNIAPTEASLSQLLRELKLRTENTPIDDEQRPAPEASKSLYTYSYLLAAVDNFKQKFNVLPEQKIDGPHGTGPVDYMITSVTTLDIIGVTEVKKDDMTQGVAQCVVQLESVIITRKRQVDEGERDYPQKAFGIVSDAEKFLFLKCLVDSEGSISLEISPRVTVDYHAENLEDRVKQVLGNIVWLLSEVQKPPGNVDSQRETKRVKTT